MKTTKRFFIELDGETFRLIETTTEEIQEAMKAQDCDENEAIAEYIIGVNNYSQWQEIPVNTANVKTLKNAFESLQGAFMTDCAECGEELTRICDKCGNVLPLNSENLITGYCMFDGMAYFCSETCLKKEYTEAEIKELFEDDEDEESDSYYTEWESPCSNDCLKWQKVQQ